MGGLSFLSPLYLLGALAIAVPILLHLFRRRTETVVDFPAVRLIAPVSVEQRRRRRLRELILLALRITALVLLAGAFARPFLAGGSLAADAAVSVVALDTSFSLSAPEPFARARELAAEAVRNAPAGDAVALVTFGDEAATIAPPTTDRGAVAAAIDGIAPGTSGTRYGAALTRAADLIGSRRGRIVIVTDLQQAGWDSVASARVPDDVEVLVVPVASPMANVAVTAAARRGAVVTASVYNYGLEAREVTALLIVEGREAGRQMAAVPAQSAASVEFDGDVPASGAAHVTIDDPGGYEADNTRYLVLDPEPATKVTVIVADPTALRGGLYVERALGAADEGRAFDATVVDGRTLSEWSAADLAAQDAIVILGTRTMNRSGRALVAGYLQGGRPLLLSLGPDVDPGTLGDIVGSGFDLPDAEAARAPDGRSTLVVGDTRHPIFRPFAQPSAALGDVPFQQFRRLPEQAGRVVLARFSGGATALVEQRVGPARVLTFTSDLDNQWNRFPLSPAFVPFVVETVRYLTEGRRTAQSWVLPSVPAGLAPVPGVFTAGGEGADTAAGAAAGGPRVAINVDVRESNPASISADELASAIVRMPRTPGTGNPSDARAKEDEQRLWQLGLLVMLVALAGEGFVGRRAN